MTDKDMKERLQEWFEILTAGARQNPEKSRAQEQWKYQNPADHFEFPRERQRREEAKRVARAKRRGKG